MIKKIRLYISPFFLTRYYLERDIKQVVREHSFNGKIIDVGCGSQPYRKLFKDTAFYRGIDYKKYSINKDFAQAKPDYFFNKDYLRNQILPFSDDYFDHSVCFQVLEHHRNPQKLIKELLRITKKGGYILISFPFLGGIHEEPTDFQRLTKYGLMEIIKESNSKLMYVKEEGSIVSTISMLLNEYLNNFAAKNKTRYYIAIFFYFPFLFFSYLSLLLDRIFRSDKIFFNYLFLIKK